MCRMGYLREVWGIHVGCISTLFWKGYQSWLKGPKRWTQTSSGVLSTYTLMIRGRGSGSRTHNQGGRRVITGVRARACSRGRARDVTSVWSSGIFPAIGVRVRCRRRGSHRVVIRV